MTTDAAIFNAVVDGIRNAEEHLDKPARIRTIMSSGMHKALKRATSAPKHAVMDTLCGSEVTIIPSTCNLWAVSFPQRT